MTIIAILLAFALCHFIRELGRIRKNQWLTSWVGFANDAFGRLPGWSDVAGFLVIIAIPLVVLLLFDRLLHSALGTTGSFLLALGVLIYSFGPRDLDTDVAEIIESDEDSQDGNGEAETGRTQGHAAARLGVEAAEIGPVAPFAVRPTVAQHRDHRLERLALQRPIRLQPHRAANTAHQQPPLSNGPAGVQVLQSNLKAARTR